jgi:acyl-coenzyme A synthetase/AMP-(fatty) acid ligase
LWRFLTTEEIARVFLPFIAFQQLAQAAEGQTSLPSSLREIITAGEQLHMSQPIARFVERLEDCHLYNHYGPTESHVVTAFPVTHLPSGWPTLPPIGRPIANTQVYILDTSLQPVPIGVPGELHIGGVALARGYLNRPELTAATFIPHPFSTEPGARLYKTGDLARYLPDGNIEFLGRLDYQVKIRGFRIELGEIESLLSHHPAIREAVVVAREDKPGDRRLVAYLRPHQQACPTSAELRSFLTQKLPDYMVPSAFVFLDALPLTANGKIDRRALPAPDQRRRELEETYVAPRSPLEELLAKVWQEVLGVERVSVYDNFFNIGGHSLLSMRVIASVEKRTGWRIYPRDLMFQTLGQLAAACEEHLPLRDSSKPMNFLQKIRHALQRRGHFGGDALCI